MTLNGYIKDESGTVSIWMLGWSVLFIAFSGLAIDVSNAYRMRAILQATADTASHAGALALASGSNAVTAATTQAGLNMTTTVVRDGDVSVGTWEPSTRTFSASGGSRPAVRVYASRKDALGYEAVPTSLLKILDFDSWNITAESVSAIQGGPCLGKFNQIITTASVEFTANATFAGDLCVHGEEGVAGTQNVTATESVVFTMANANPAPNTQQINATTHGWGVAACSEVNANGNATGHPCNRVAAPLPGGTSGFMAGVDVPGRIAAVLSDDIQTHTSCLNGVCATQTATATVNPSDPTVAPTDSDLNYMVLSGHTKNGQNNKESDFEEALDAGWKKFHISCASKNTKFKVPDMAGVTIYSGPYGGSGDGCAFEMQGNGANASVNLDNVTIATTSDLTGNGASSNAAIRMNGQPSAAPAACDPDMDNGLSLLAIGDVHFTAGADFPSVQILTLGGVRYTANAASTTAVQIIAGGKVEWTANGTFAPVCPFDTTDDAIPDNQVAIVQ